MPRKPYTSTAPIIPEQNKSDKGHSSNDQVLTPTTPSVADLERDYGQAVSLPAERKSQALDDIGSASQSMHDMTYETEHSGMATSIASEARQDINPHPTIPKDSNDPATEPLISSEQTKGHDDTEQATSNGQDAVHNAETSDFDRHRYNFHQAMELLARFKSLGELEDLQNSISFMNTAIRLMPDGHPDKPVYLDHLSNAFKIRFDRLDRVEDLGIAITHVQKAIDLTPNDHPYKPLYLTNLGFIFGIRFNRSGHVEDLEMGIAQLQMVVDLTPDGHLDKPARLKNLGDAFRTRFDRFDRVEDLDIAIAHLQNAVDLTPDGHPDQSGHLINLGLVLDTRFERLDRFEDLEMVIAHTQKALDLMPDDHSDKPRHLKNLGMAFDTRFERLGRINDLALAVTHKQKALDLTPDGHPDKPDYFSGVGTTLMKRFDQLNRMDDLEMAITHKQKAVDLAPDGHPDKPHYLNKLGSVIEKRFDWLDSIEDLELAIMYRQKALDLTPDDHPDKLRRLNKLGKALDTRFDRLGRVQDLELSIAYQQKALDLTPDGHPDRLHRLSSLGSTFKTRFERLGRVEDLEMAIKYSQKVVDLTPDNHRKKPGRLISLGSALRERFDRLNHIEDLEMAITHAQKALELTPDDHPKKPSRLNSLGISLNVRFERLGRINDLELAITHQQKGLDLLPNGHPNRSLHLDSLGSALHARFVYSNRIEDLEMAIGHKQSAADLTPDDHPEKPSSLSNLGSTFEERFDLLGHVEDLEIAIANVQKAVDLTPIDHPDSPHYLNRLGGAFIKRFESLNHVEDLKAALMKYSTAASLSTGYPSDRLEAARLWAGVSQLLESLEVPISSHLEPYRIAIDLLPRVAWLGVPISTQHALLEDVGGTVRDAVSAAITEGKYDTAVEWAEAGRSIAWQNLLNLRSPVSELRSAHSSLADRLETIFRQLDMSVKGKKNSTMDETKKDPRSLVQLALDWDNIVAEIRSKPGFEAFLKPRRFDELKAIARDGPVFILNINEDRCDALVLIPQANADVHVSNIPLSGFSYAKGQALLEELKGLLLSKHLRDRNCRKPRRRPVGHESGPLLEHVLRGLWLDVVKPIIDALEYQPRSTDLPHIWWCATGPLAFLPIHAAGLYDTDEPGSKLSDYAISSYTPTLSSLLNDSTPSKKDFRLLAVAQANAPGASPIPETEVELKKIQKLSMNINITTMTKKEATIEKVWRGMEKSNWVHLACHGQQNIKEPMKSGLLLHDGTLELQRLIEKPLPYADFAFLSACQTATGDENVAEESLHLAAGMLFAGYKGVIATMWSIMDDVGPRVAEDVYRVMLKDGKPNRKAAAYALHEAVRRLREDSKVDLLHWVPFIHIGL